jgi:hypothetical protein
VIARELDYGEPGKIREAEGTAEEVSRMLWVLIEKLGQTGTGKSERAVAD